MNGDETTGRRQFRFGEPVPWFKGRTAKNPTFTFDTVAGRYVILLFLGSARAAASAKALKAVAANRALFDDARVSLFGITADPDDEREGGVADDLPGIRFFFDDDGAISRLYGRLDADGYQPLGLLLDSGLRVVASAPLENVETLLDLARRLPVEERPAPVLVVPRVLEPPLCRRLIDYYEANGGEDSGFMREVEGKTVGLVDHSHKRRRDCTIEEEALRGALRVRLRDRLAPEILRAFQFRATHVERYIVACYDAGEGGYFRPHRDNTTKGTAHRRFAVTINLNTEEFEGGELRFPEFGSRIYRAPTGGAVVFSCSLLHEALPVTKGRRYATLPFLYDEPAAELRERNLKYVA